MAKMSPIVPMMLVTLGIIGIIGGTVYYIQEREKLVFNQDVNVATIPFGIDSEFGQGESTFPQPTVLNIPSDGVYLTMIYFFNISNPLQYLNGTQDPIFQKIGPYSYDSFGATVNKRWFEKGNIYCSAGFTTFHRFVPEFSAGSESDVIYVHDAVYHPIIALWTEKIFVGGAASDLAIGTYMGIVTQPWWVHSVYPFKAPEYLPAYLNNIASFIATNRSMTPEEAKNYTLTQWASGTSNSVGIPSWFRVSGSTPSGITLEQAIALFDSDNTCAFTHYFVYDFALAAAESNDIIGREALINCGLGMSNETAMAAYQWYAHTFNDMILSEDLAWDYGVIAPAFLYIPQFKDSSLLYVGMDLFYPDNFYGPPELRPFMEPPATNPDFDGFELFYILTGPMSGRVNSRPIIRDWFIDPTPFPNVFDQPGVPAFNLSVQLSHTKLFIEDYIYNPIWGQVTLNVNPALFIAGDPFIALNTTVIRQTRQFSAPWYEKLYKGNGGAGLINFPDYFVSIPEAESVLEPFCIYTGKEDMEQFAKPVVNYFAWNGVPEPIIGRDKANLGRQFIWKNNDPIRIWDNLLSRSYLWNKVEEFSQNDLPFVKYVPAWDADTLAYTPENAKYGVVGPGTYNMAFATTDNLKMFRTRVNFVGCDPAGTIDHIQGMTQVNDDPELETYYIYEHYTGLALANNYVWQINLFNSKDIYYNYYLTRKMTTDVLKPAWIIRDSFSVFNRKTGIINDDINFLFHFNIWDIIRKSRNIVICLCVIGSALVIAGVVVGIIMIVKK